MTTDPTDVTTTPAPPVGAAFREATAWSQINWRRAHRTVRRLQTRIVQAT